MDAAPRQRAHADGDLWRGSGTSQAAATAQERRRSEVEAAAGKTIPKLFVDEGETAFRMLEQEMIVAALGALYVHLGDLQPVTAIFYGVSPAVIALILHSCHRLAKLGMERRTQAAAYVARMTVENEHR